MAPAFTRPMTAQEAVLGELRRCLVDGMLRPGDQIRQDALAEELGVSRVPVREAMRILEGEGQIAYTPHRGYFVAELDVEELAEIYRLRDILETEAVRVGFHALTEADTERMAQSMDEMREAAVADNIAALTVSNRTFHFTLFASSGMNRLLRILAQLWDSSDPYRSMYFSNPEHLRIMEAEHEAIWKAVVARDEKLLLRLLEEHRAHAVPALRKVLVASSGVDRT
ncbi:MAG: GntR family transcriptional regulator [Rhizobiales bacterium]|nr:GntR family transcriptional regulator [Hyphomicrobiales bacterium]